MYMYLALKDTFIEFQYCFLHDILINKLWLNTWKLREDWLCTFCNEKLKIYAIYFGSVVYTIAFDGFLK